MPAIHQFTAGLRDGDAVTNETLAMRDIFRAWGHDSEIFTDPGACHPGLPRYAMDIDDCREHVDADTVAILHFSIGSAVNARFADLSCRKALLYHNITPAHYFQVVNPQIAHDLARGRKQLESLAGTADINLADSAFNARELAELGYRDVKVLPLILDFSSLSSAPDTDVLEDFDDGRKNILFVGRAAPNKRLEDVIDAFAALHRSVDPNSRLILVGSALGAESYHGALLGIVHDLHIEAAVRFAGLVTQSQLNAFYRCADVFLCMSEHEGFCIPVMEGMIHDVPVMAYAAAAVPETMDGAGILFKNKEFGPIAEMMGRLAGDAGFRNAVIEGQRERVARFRARDPAAELKQHLSPVLSP